MLIHGEPGTGKSQVIQTTTQNFIRRGIKYMLATETGITAKNADGHWHEGYGDPECSH